MTEWDYMDDYERIDYCYELRLKCERGDNMACIIVKELCEGGWGEGCI